LIAIYVKFQSLGWNEIPLGCTATAFTALAKENINIEMISTSEIKVSMVIDQKYAELAVRTLHSVYELDK